VPVSVVLFAGDSQVSPSPRTEWWREEMSQTIRLSLAEERQGDDDLYKVGPYKGWCLLSRNGVYDGEGTIYDGDIYLVKVGMAYGHKHLYPEHVQSPQDI